MQSDTAERILQTANTLLIDRGYSAFSYADIAGIVQIRKASIHHHFPTKANLVVAVLRAHRARIHEGMRALETHNANPLHRLHGYFRYWQGCIADGSMSFCIGALLSAEMPSLPPEVQAEVRQHFHMLAEWFEQTLTAGRETGQIHLDHTIPAEAQVLIAALHGAMLSARATGSTAVFHTVSHAALTRLAPTTPIPQTV